MSARSRAAAAPTKAGVKAGDVITAVDGTSVSSAERLRAIISSHKPGDTLTLTVKRSGETKTFKVTLGSRSAS